MTYQTPRPRTRAGRACSFLILLIAPLRCTGNDDAVGASGSRADCAGSTWRASTAMQVACPGPPGCHCPLGEVCCIPPTPPPGGTGTCTTLTACADVAFACDGPEDCAPGEVCCAKGYSAQCSAETDCSGLDAYVLCHADEHCDGEPGTTCGPADPNTFWDTLLGVCR